MKYTIVYVQIDITTALGMWAPIIAEHIRENIYRLTDKEPINAKDFDNWRKKIEQSAYDPELEEWEFPPGTMVRCEWFTGERGDIHLRAVEKTEL